MAETTMSSKNLTTFLQPVVSCSSLQSPRSLILPLSSLSLPYASLSRAHSLNLATQSRRRSFPVVNATSTTTFSPKIRDILTDVSIFTDSGEPVMFKDLWNQHELLGCHGRLAFRQPGRAFLDAVA